MKWKLLNDNGLKTYAMVFDSGDDVLPLFKNFVKKQNLKAGQFTAIGAFSKVTLGFFDFSKKDYKKIEMNEQVEVLSLIGDVTLHKEEHKVHPHVVVGKSDGTAHGGHLLQATVHPTLEVIVQEAPGYLQRKVDEETGLPLIEI